MKVFQLKNICLLAALALTSWACSDDDNWTPGELVESNQVSFTTGDPDAVEIEAGEAYNYTFTLTRDDATDAASVPLTLSDSEHFSAPATVEFAAGEQTKDITVTFNGEAEAGVYDCTVSIPEGAFNSPYTTKTASVSLSVTVAVWDFVFTANFYNFSVLNEFHADLYQLHGQNLYRFKNFMKDFDFTFRLSDSGQMTPQGGLWDGNIWYFNPNGWESYPLYLTEEEGCYIDWVYLWADTNYNVLHFDDGWGMLTISYYKYDAAGNDLGNAYEYAYIDWEK